MMAKYRSSDMQTNTMLDKYGPNALFNRYEVSQRTVTIRGLPERLHYSAHQVTSEPFIGYSPSNLHRYHDVRYDQVGNGQIEYQQIDSQLSVAVLEQRYEDGSVADA